MIIIDKKELVIFFSWAARYMATRSGKKKKKKKMAVLFPRKRKADCCVDMSAVSTSGLMDEPRRKEESLRRIRCATGTCLFPPFPRVSPSLRDYSSGKNESERE